MKLIDGKMIANKNLIKIKSQVTKLRNQGIVPKLAVVLVGDDKASLSYIRKKEESCRAVGIDFELFKFPENIKEDVLIKKLDIVQKDSKLTALIIQLPLPRKLNSRRVLNHIIPELDVDCLTSYCLGMLTAGEPLYVPPTAGAVIEMLETYNVKYHDKHIVVVGRGALVGKPLSIILTQKENTVTLCGGNTKNLGNFTKQADILLTAVGKEKLITGNMVKAGAIVLDSGIFIKNGKIYGDVDFSTVSKKAKLITPVPGGVGPVTVAKLLENVVKSAKNRIS